MDYRDVRAALPEGCADVVGRVVGADDDGLLALVPVRPRMLGGVVLIAAEDVHARDVGHVRLAGHPRRHHELLRAQGQVRAVALDDQDPLAGLLVVPRALRRRRRPVVELHDPRVHLEPVGDLVLRREDRPVLGELDVRQMVVPDRVVQAERLVALAPRVPRMRVALDDDRGHAELAQPRPERDAALAATDDHDVRLRLVAELPGLALALLEPRLAAGPRAVLGTGRPARSDGLLMALELVQSGEQRPRLAVLEAQVPAAAPDLGLELDPRLGDAVGGRGRLGRTPAAGLRVAERGVEHRPDAVPALDRLDVPRECDEVAPVAVVAEQIGRGGGVALCQRILEAREPRIDLGGDGRGGGVGHGSSWAGTGGSILPDHTTGGPPPAAPPPEAGEGAPRPTRRRHGACVLTRRHRRPGRPSASKARRDASDRAGSPWLLLLRGPDQLGCERTLPHLAFGVRLVELSERDRHVAADDDRTLAIVGDDHLHAACVARRREEPEPGKQLDLAVDRHVPHAGRLDPFANGVVVLGAGVVELATLDVDRPPAEEVVAAAVVEVQVRVDDDVDAGEIEVLLTQRPQPG